MIKLKKNNYLKKQNSTQPNLICQTRDSSHEDVIIS